MSTLPWLRLYTETLSDRKIKLISIETGYPKPLIIGVWTSLLMLAGESPDRGKLLTAAGKPLPFAFMADEIGLASNDLQIIIDAFIEVDMVSLDEYGAYIISKWDERQFKSDDSYERVKKFRRKQKAKKGTEASKERDGDSQDETIGDGYPKRFDSDTRNVSETFQETAQSTETDSTSNEVGEFSPKPEDLKGDARKTTPKWRLMYQFLDSSNIPYPGKKPDQRFWWSNISEIYNSIADKDVDLGERLIRDSIKKLRQDRLTIGGPESIIKTCRDLVAQRNGASPPTTLTPAQAARARQLAEQDRQARQEEKPP